MCSFVKKVFHKKSQYVFFLFLFLVLPVFPVFSQTYEEIYAYQYEDALILKNKYSKFLNVNNVYKPEFYIAIVFPEMMRYSEFRDEIEALLNKMSYTTLDEFSGCSIGPFQMKPEFAEKIELYIAGSIWLSKKYNSLRLVDLSNSFRAKLARIDRLEDEKFQALYLMAFVDICEEKYNLSDKTLEEKVRIISTLYNAGFLDSLDGIEYFYKQKAFPDGKNNKNSLWNYSDLAVYYYKLFTK